MTEHVLPKRIYYLVSVTLLMMTVLTMEVAFFNFGLLNFWIAISIAIFKASLVVLYFMHARYSGSLMGVFVVTGFIFLAILLTFTMGDLMTRPWQYQPDPSAFSMLLPR